MGKFLWDIADITPEEERRLTQFVRDKKVTKADLLRVLSGQPGIAFSRYSGGQQSSGTPERDEDDPDFKAGRAARDAEYRARGMEPPKDKAPDTSAMSQEDKWFAEGRATRDADLRARGIDPYPDGSTKMSRETSIDDTFAPVTSVERQHKAAPEIADIRSLADQYHAALDELDKLEGAPVPNKAQGKPHTSDPEYDAYCIRCITARQKVQAARSALVDACRQADQAGRPLPPEYRPGGSLHPDNIDIGRKAFKEARASRDAELRMRGMEP